MHNAERDFDFAHRISAAVRRRVAFPLERRDSQARARL
jgi:hypothetical protein